MTIKKFFLAAALSFSLVTLGDGQVYAINSVCKTDETVFTKIGNAFKALDIRKTVNNMLGSMLTDGVMNLVAGRNSQQMTECAYSTVAKLGTDTGNTYLKDAADNACGTVTVTENCDDMVKTYDATNINSGTAFKTNQTGGSFLGMANALDGAIRTEPIPVNLAYYWNDQIKSTPFVSRALAADVQYGNAPAISSILVLWKTFRNIAMGMLSVIMLVVGIMIMTRKKLSPQLSVTAQYALPRIALALILIVFSYPIGAVIASSMRYLAVLGEKIVCNSPLTTSMATCPAPTGVLLGVFFIGAVIAIAASGGAFIPVLVVLAVVMLIVVVLKIVILVRAALLYMKLILSIVFSPIIFATGALPGNESATQNYLKQWLSYLVGYVGLFVFAAVVDIIVLIMVTGPFTSGFTPGTTVTMIFTILFCPVIWMFGYMQALKIPGKAKDLIMGEQKPKGRK